MMTLRCLHNLIIIKLPNKMLIKHILIPRNSHLAALQEHQKRQQTQEPVNYQNHMTRTLNPEQPANDILVSHVTPKNYSLNSQISRPLFNSFQNPRFLMEEYPQTIEQFTDCSFAPQQTQQIKSRHSSKNGAFWVKQSYQTIAGNLHNRAYIKSLPKYNSSNLTQLQKVQNNSNLRKQESTFTSFKKQSDSEQDEGLVNRHSKSVIKHGDVYRTIQKSQKKGLQNSYNIYPKQRKYNLSLQKQSLNGKQYFSSLTPVNNKKLIQFQLQESRSPRAYLPLRTKKKILPKESEGQQKNSSFALQESSIVSSPIQTVQISYRTSLTQLRKICLNPQFAKSNVTMKIPEIFSCPQFTGKEDQDELFRKASQIIKHLQIKQRDSISIKKYSNCILILIKKIAIIWHFSRKVYFGGWQHKMFDEGVKSGLGLEWSPNRFVYYGQFSNNKREGIGIMKKGKDQLLAGLWKENKFVRPLGNLEASNY